MSAQTSSLSSFSRFTTLLQREWLQHRVAWGITIAAPLLITVLVLVIGEVHLSVSDDVHIDVGQLPALALGGMAIVGCALLTFVLAWMSVLIQTPGLARRDQQDRSIEFWLSLPVGHGAAVGAPLLAHLLLFPLAALGIGLLGGHLLSLLLVVRFFGLGEWLAMPWGVLLLATTAQVVRVAAGLVLATLWLAPLIGLVMVASAWLKRWGLPALVGTLVVAGNLLDKLYGNTVVWDLGQRLLIGAGQAFVNPQGKSVGLNFRPGSDPVQMLADYPGRMVADLGRALADLADPLLLGGLVVAAGCYALLMLRRRRGGL